MRAILFAVILILSPLSARADSTERTLAVAGTSIFVGITAATAIVAWIVSNPKEKTEDLEQLGSWSKNKLPDNLYASISGGEE